MTRGCIAALLALAACNQTPQPTTQETQSEIGQGCVRGLTLALTEHSDELNGTRPNFEKVASTIAKTFGEVSGKKHRACKVKVKVSVPRRFNGVTKFVRYDLVMSSSRHRICINMSNNSSAFLLKDKYPTTSQPRPTGVIAANTVFLAPCFDFDGELKGYLDTYDL